MHCEAVIEKVNMACFSSGHRIEDHFGDVTEMVETRQRKRLGATEPPTKKTGK